jgi:dihydroorotate dehydrogenase
MYKRFLKPILFLFSPESVHNFFITFGKIMGNIPLARFKLSLFYKYRPNDLEKIVDGIKYRTPILLSAGFDYNGHLSKILPAISFGGEEVGSVTAEPCAGNPSPRLFRLPFSEAILVNKGLKNDGVMTVLSRLEKKKKPKDFVIGLSLARTNKAATCDLESGIADYMFSLEKAVESPVIDYITINISCPNSFGGEDFSQPERLEKLFVELDKVKSTKPVYVKMPISIPDNFFVKLLTVLNRHNVQGVVIGNLQKDYRHIDARDLKLEKYSGGLSGKPCAERSNELIRLTRSEYKDRFTIIGCGGIFLLSF